MINYPDLPPWVPLDAWDAYSDESRDTESRDGQLCLDRLVTRTEMMKFYDKFRNAFGYLDWRIFFGACSEAVTLNYQKMHDALREAKKLSTDIAGAAAKLAEMLEEYQTVCLNGRVRADAPAGGVIDNNQALIETLQRLASESESHTHARYGTGQESWGSRVQATDGLPQFVRLVSARLKIMYAEQMPDLTSPDLARLAVASLNINPTADDYMGKVEERVKKLKP